MTEVSEAIRQKRMELGMTQEQFAKLCGVTPLAVHKWEAGKSKPKLQRLKELNIHTTQQPSNPRQLDGVKPIDESNVLYVPLISSNYAACAGDGNCYEDMQLEFDGVCRVDSPELSALYSADSLIAMKVEGDSMVGRRIYDGDTVIFCKTNEWTNGNIYLVCLDGRLMVKGIVSQGTGKLPILRSASLAYNDIILTENNSFAVLGRILEVQPKSFKPAPIM